MRFAGHLLWVLAGVVVLTMVRPAVGRTPILVVRPFYAPYPPVAVFSYRPYGVVVVPAVPRAYDFRGLDPVWAGVYGGTYGGAYRMAPPQAFPTYPSIPEVIPTPSPAAEPNGSGRRAL